MSIDLRRTILRASTGALALVGTLTAHPALATTLLVANNGEDSFSCGGKSDPCRSISRAIQLANPGDQIVVGPGRYGNLDYDSTIGGPGEPGEEAAELNAGCKCMIKVDKAVQIVSRDGAAATVIDGGARPPLICTPEERARLGSLVNITASDVVFGATKKGFQLRGLRCSGIQISSTGPRARVTDNRVTVGYYGILDVAGQATITGNLVTGRATVGVGTLGGKSRLIANSVVGAESVGFQLFGRGDVAINNVARGSYSDSDGRPHGFSVLGSTTMIGNRAEENEGDGIRVAESGAQLIGNVVSGNRDGIELEGTGHAVSGNVVSGNTFSGVIVSSTGSTVTGNAIVGNGAPGVFVAPDGSASVTGNNLVGNNAVLTFVFLGGFNAPPELLLNCGLLNESPNVVDASNNFWGDAGGPGPNPADDLCSIGSGAGSSIIPIAEKEFKVKAKVKP